MPDRKSPAPYVPRLEPLEDRRVPAVVFREFPVFSPADIAPGPDGNLWFTQGPSASWSCERA